MGDILSIFKKKTTIIIEIRPLACEKKIKTERYFVLEIVTSGKIHIRTSCVVKMAIMHKERERSKSQRIFSLILLIESKQAVSIKFRSIF